MKKKIIIICLLSILAFFIGKTAYDSFMLNSYYSHGDELIAKIEKYNMERHTYPLSLDSIGIKGYDLGGGLIYKNLSFRYSCVGIGDFRLSFYYGSSFYTYSPLLRKWSKDLDLDTLNIIRKSLFLEISKMEKQKKMRQVLRIIPQNKLKQFKEFSVSDTDSIYFVQNYYTNNDIAEEGFVKRDKGTFCRIGRWKFYAKDGRRIIVSYEDKKYSKGIIIEEGFLHSHFDYFY